LTESTLAPMSGCDVDTSMETTDMRSEGKGTSVGGKEKGRERKRERERVLYPPLHPLLFPSPIPCCRLNCCRLLWRGESAVCVDIPYSGSNTQQRHQTQRGGKRRERERCVKQRKKRENKKCRPCGSVSSLTTNRMTFRVTFHVY
jgi:hypothetical protein